MKNDNLTQTFRFSKQKQKVRVKQDTEKCTENIHSNWIQPSIGKYRLSNTYTYMQTDLFSFA